MEKYATLIDLLFVAMVFIGVLYWIFVSPKRARIHRRETLRADATGHFQPWDKSIGARRRER